MNLEYTYNLHCHSLLSDGTLLPSEVAVRYASAGYNVIAITDHADYSNIGVVVSAITEFTRHWPKDAKIRVLPGIELTHIPPKQFKPLCRYARRQGIKIIVAHGQTPVEPVAEGTNLAALEADIDILAHPGFIRDEEIKIAKEKGIFLEITSRKGHRKTNSFVVRKALESEASLIINTDSHSPEDIVTIQQLKGIAIASGLNQQNINSICRTVKQFLRKKEAGICI